MTKIVLVTYGGGTIRWFPYSLETLEDLAADSNCIEDIQIIKCGVDNTQIIITKANSLFSKTNVRIMDGILYHLP